MYFFANLKKNNIFNLLSLSLSLPYNLNARLVLGLIKRRKTPLQDYDLTIDKGVTTFLHFTNRKKNIPMNER